MPATNTAHITLEAALALALDAHDREEHGRTPVRVRSTEHPDTIGEVRPGTYTSTLLVVWVQNEWYDARLRDYIASTEWDLLDALIDTPLDGALPLAHA